MQDRRKMRGKRKENGEWVYVSYVCIKFPGNREPECYIVEKTGTIVQIYSGTECQCTGQKDKNGDLIWEYDILVAALDEEHPEEHTYIKIIWDGAGFKYKEYGSTDKDYIDQLCLEEYEISGNAVDNVWEQEE